MTMSRRTVLGLVLFHALIALGWFIQHAGA